jgi:hypothetical protein
MDKTKLFNKDSYYLSEQFKKDFAEQVTKDTWGKGLPKIYMDDDKNIVEHWEDGTINIIKYAAKES